MLKVEFGPDSGGERSFENAEGLISYIREQKQAWNDHVLINGRANQPGNNELKLIPQAWANLESTVTQAQAQQASLPQRLPGLIQGNDQARLAIRTDSVPARHLSDISEEIGFEEAGGAAKLHLSPHNSQIFQSMTKAQAVGMIEFQQRMAGVTSKSVRTARDSARQMVQSLNADVTAHREKLEFAEKQHQETVDSLTTAGQQQKADIETWKTSTDEAINALREEWEAKYQSTYEDFTEKLKLDSAVKLWGDRAAIHEGRSAKWQKRSIIVAACGLVIALGVAWGALAGAEWLFADAFVEAEGAPLPSGLRPTWRYELIFASSATLLYLTMFFWIMRIVVRIYMTEQHLAIDATSRSSMAETYLALIKQGAATDQDRAIVLASLFRPIVDGIVKDDGLPAINPAAILSGLAVGKSGGS